MTELPIKGPGQGTLAQSKEGSCTMTLRSHKTSTSSAHTQNNNANLTCQNTEPATEKAQKDTMCTPRAESSGLMMALKLLRMLEKLLTKHKPEGELRKDLEVVTEVTRTLAGKELAGQTAAINVVSTIQDQMKADLCSLYKALDSRLVEIQNGQEKILTSTEQLSKTTNNLHSTAKELETKVVKVTNTTDKIANTTMSYRDALLTKTDSSNRAAVDPKVLNSIERRVKQILIKHAPMETEGAAIASLAELKDKANNIITDMDDYFCPEVTIVETATRTKDGSILLTLNSREAVEWLREPENKYSFLKMFTEGAVMKDCHHNILM